MKSLIFLLIGACATLLLDGCASQTYDPKPIVPNQMADAFVRRSLDSPALRDYMLAQGYPQDAFPIKQWGLRELTLAAYFHHPRLDVARAQWRAAQAAEITAGQRPNPQLSATLEHHGQTAGGISPWTYGISLAIPVETGGKRQARLAQAANLSEAARIDIARSAWQVRGQLRDSLLEYHASLRKIELLRQEVKLREDIVQMVEKRLRAGFASSSDNNQSRLQRQQAQQSLDAENGRLPGLRAALASACGLPPGALDAIELAPMPADIGNPAARFSDLDIRRAALLNRLDLRAALARYDAAEAALRLEIAKQYPDFTLAPGYLWDQGDAQWSLVPSVILNLMNKNEGPIAEARAQRELQGSQFMALQSRIIGDLEQSYINYTAVTGRLAGALQSQESRRSRVIQVDRQFAAGHVDRLEAVGARLEGLAAQQGALEAEMDARRALNVLEDAVQQPLDGSAPLPESPQESPAYE